MTEEEIFIAAIKLTGQARAAFLQGACGTNEGLRGQVEALLRAHDESGDLPLDPLPMRPEVTGDPTTRPRCEYQEGTRIAGRYQLLESIGEGGMGTVWVAQQLEPVRRKVAIKLIKPGMDSRQVLARFEAERQALAVMDHPSIAKVFDGGITDDGRPYFVMEYVKGVALTEYCDSARLDLRARLRLFVPICQAVQHAHQKGIIHRDLKPSNILVCLYDGQAMPKVIDFGLAKAMHQSLTEQTVHTAHGMMVGTPLYMSPEQAEFNNLDIDTRSDIYSLGVVLYELLTGSTPLERQQLKEAALNEVLRLIKEVEPPKPSTRVGSSANLPSLAAQRSIEPARLSKSILGDLDWIVMKSLEKERSRRYETANGLARDIERFLGDEAVEACPPSAAYRWRKFARKHRRALCTVGAFASLLLLTTAFSTWQAIRARQAERVAQHHAAVAMAQAQRAEDAENRTLEDYRVSTDDAIQQLIGSKPVLGPQEKIYLENTLKRWRAFAARQGDDEVSRGIRQEGHQRVAHLWERLGRNEEARSEFAVARDLAKQLVASHPEVPENREALASTENGLGIVLSELGDHDAARAAWEAARDLWQQLAAEFPEEPNYQQGLGMSHSNLGKVFAELGLGHEARIALESARKVEQQLVTEFPSVPAYRQELAATHCNLGILNYSLGALEVARADLDAARVIQQPLVKEFSQEPEYRRELALTDSSLGTVLRDLGDHDAARAAYKSARDLQQQLAADFPVVPRYREDLAETHNGLGDLYRELRELSDARASLESHRDLYQQLVAQFPGTPDYRARLANAHNALGILYGELGEMKDAQAAYEMSRDLLQPLTVEFPSVPEYKIVLGGTYCNLGNLMTHQDLPAVGVHWLDQAISTLTPVVRPSPTFNHHARNFIRNSYINRALARERLRDYAIAAEDWGHAIALSSPKDQLKMQLERARVLVKAGMAWTLEKQPAVPTSVDQTSP